MAANFSLTCVRPLIQNRACVLTMNEREEQWFPVSIWKKNTGENMEMFTCALSSASDNRGYFPRAEGGTQETSLPMVCAHSPCCCLCRFYGLHFFVFFGSASKTCHLQEAIVGKCPRSEKIPLIAAPSSLLKAIAHLQPWKAL